MAEGARKAACSSVRGHFCFDGNQSVAQAPRHRVNVARETGTGAQGAGLDFYFHSLTPWVNSLRGKSPSAGPEEPHKSGRLSASKLAQVTRSLICQDRGVDKHRADQDRAGNYDRMSQKDNIAHGAI